MSARAPRNRSAWGEAADDAARCVKDLNLNPTAHLADVQQERKQPNMGRHSKQNRNLTTKAVAGATAALALSLIHI